MSPAADTKPRTAARKRMSGAERRDQILDVAMEQAEARGFHAALDRRRRQGGRHLPPDRLPALRRPHGLLNAVVDREGERAVAQLADPPPHRGRRPIRASSSSGRSGAFLEAVNAEPVRWRLILMPPEGAPEVMRERFERERAGVTAQLATVVGPALASAPGAPEPRRRASGPLAAGAGRGARPRRPRGPRALSGRPHARVRALGAAACSRSSPPRRDSAAGRRTSARRRGAAGPRAAERSAGCRGSSSSRSASSAAAWAATRRFAPASVSATTWRRRSAGSRALTSSRSSLEPVEQRDQVRRVDPKGSRELELGRRTGLGEVVEHREVTADAGPCPRGPR